MATSKKGLVGGPIACEKYLETIPYDVGQVGFPGGDFSAATATVEAMA